MTPEQWVPFVAKFWPEAEWVTAVAVIGGESDWDERSHYVNSATGDDSFGGAQINMRGALGPERRRLYGLRTNEALFDPETNCRVAYGIWLEAGRSWRPWGAFTSGGYRKYGRYEAAEKAVAGFKGASVAWYVAKSIRGALAQANTRWPSRSKSADGTIGDASHSSRTSDHNPASNGCVHAFDLTHDPAHGVDTYKLWDSLRLRAKSVASFARIVKYLISNDRFASAATAWEWEPYANHTSMGANRNRHTHHGHCSINYSYEAENWAGSWWTQEEEDVLTAVSREEFDELVAKVSRILDVVEETVVVEGAKKRVDGIKLIKGVVDRIAAKVGA